MSNSMVLHCKSSGPHTRFTTSAKFPSTKITEIISTMLYYVNVLHSVVQSNTNQNWILKNDLSSQEKDAHK